MLNKHNLNIHRVHLANIRYVYLRLQSNVHFQCVHSDFIMRHLIP